MRISDWSSDVCSSDLALDRRPKIMVTVGILGERVGVYLDGLGEIERDAVAVRRQDAFSEREDRAVHDERAGRRCAGQQTPEPLGPRSEEHTSELQSLMRISYAVFCLKKKTQQTETTHIKNKDQARS